MNTLAQPSLSEMAEELAQIFRRQPFQYAPPNDQPGSASRLIFIGIDSISQPCDASTSHAQLEKYP